LAEAAVLLWAGYTAALVVEARTVAATLDRES
jgi:hypothetical protein